MKSSPHLPFLSPLLLLLLLLPALPVQAWFVRLLLSSSAHRQTKTKIDLLSFFALIQNCVQGSLNSGAGRCLGNGPDFPLKFTCHLVRSFFFLFFGGGHTQRSRKQQRRKRNMGAKKLMLDLCICIRMENVWRMEMDVRRIRMSLENLGRRRGVRIRSREMGGGRRRRRRRRRWMKRKERKKGDRQKKDHQSFNSIQHHPSIFSNKFFFGSTHR